MGTKLVSVISDNIISPLGYTTEANFSAVKAGKTELKRYEGTEGLKDPFVASLLDHENFIVTDTHYSLFERLAILSIQKALATCDTDVTSKTTLIIISTTKGNVDMLRANEEGLPFERVLAGNASKAIAEFFGNPNTPLVVSNACTSGVCAQIEAYRLIQSGRYDDVIVCGVDVVSQFIISGFQSLKALSDKPCRPFDEDRTGINLGDAAATIIFRGTTPEGTASGTWYLSDGAICNDGFHISAPSPKGEGCYRVLRSILSQEDAGSPIAFINAHGTGTLFNDEMESVAIDRAGLSAQPALNLVEVPVNSLKGYFGHTMGAAGVLETIISMKAAEEGIIIGTRGYENMGVSRRINICKTTQPITLGVSRNPAFIKMLSGFGGCNAAVLFKRFTTHSSNLKPQTSNLKPQTSQLIAEISLSPRSLIINGEEQNTTHETVELNSLYRDHINNYPKYHKMDGLCKLSFVASELLLGTVEEERFVPREDRAVVLFNRSGSLDADHNYQKTISDPDNFFPSPSIFVYTLPNIATGEIAIRNKYLGETSFFVIDHFDKELIHSVIEGVMTSPSTKSILAGWVDYYDNNNFEAKLQLIKY